VTSGGRTAWVLGDQLSLDNPALEGADRVLLVESEAKLRSGRFHRQKLHLMLSAMRHFGAGLEDRGVAVDHRRAPTLRAGLEDHVRQFAPDEVVVLEPASAAGRDALGALPRVRLLEGSLFLTDAEEFAGWAAGRERLVMEDFYRRQRRRLGVLMDGDEPAGGRWNFDGDNRRPAPRDARPPAVYRPREDEIDAAVRRDLDELSLQTFGDDAPRRWPATREQALRALRRFVDERLPDFGRWQDAMLHGERSLWHSLLSSSLNLGLLSPLECVEAAERAYRSGAAPIAAVEGFVRQLIGWREYVWCLYRLREREWGRMNALRAHAPLPEVLWGGPTEMRCVGDAVSGLRETAYAHHIERLMLFGNLVLLLGVHPRAALEWFHHAFIDGYEWVMAPNVLGMATFADGGRMMTKPYAAGGRYVQRMSDHCGGCRYRPDRRTGDDACPFSTLYWDFLDRNREQLAGNHRMRMAYRNLDAIDLGELDEIRRRGRALRREFRA
jgi:deoxyribodipyrimidine photolyase-related protein